MTDLLARKYDGKTLLLFAVPTMIMNLFMALYTMVDGIFVASFVSSDALAGLNLVIPGLSLLVACSVLISSGGSVAVSRKLGQGREQEARAGLSALTALTVLWGCAIAILALVFTRPILAFLGATERLYPIACEYYQTLAMFTVPCLLQVQFQYFFVAAGAPGLGLACVVAGGVSNMVLDGLFVAVLDLGIRGAALATGIGYSIPAVVGLIRFIGFRRGILYFVRPGLAPGFLRESVVNGIAGMLASLSGAIVTWLYNRRIVGYLGEMGISAATIVLYARFLLNSVAAGYSSGISPIVSFHWGGKHFDQVRVLFRASLRVVAAESVLTLAISALTAEEIVRLFIAGDPPLAQLAKHGIMLFSISYLFNGINVFAAGLFSALNNGRLSTAIAVGQMLCLVAAIWILPKLGLEADGVWLAVPAAEAFSAVASVFLLWKNRAVYHL